MPDLTPPIEVKANTGLIDTLAAAFRLLLVIIGTVPLLLKLLGNRDFAGLVAYFQSADGTTFVGAISALAAIIYGLWKTFRRGKQAVTLAERSPDRVATVV